MRNIVGCARFSRLLAFLPLIYFPNILTNRKKLVILSLLRHQACPNSKSIQSASNRQVVGSSPTGRSIMRP